MDAAPTHAQKDAEVRPDSPGRIRLNHDVNQVEAAASTDRLAAIARGESFNTATHEEILQETAVLEIDGFNLWYGEKQALFDNTLTIAKDKVTAMIGPSGCGKSTLLRSVNRMNDLVDSVRIDRRHPPRGRPDLRRRRGRDRAAQANGHGLPEAQSLSA